MKTLPEANRDVLARVSTNIMFSTFLHWLTPIKSTMLIKVLEISTHVISEIDAIFREAACCSPVGGVNLQKLHSCQTQPVLFLVVGVFVHWRVVLEGNVVKRGKSALQSAPRHHQGAGGTRLRLHVTVSWVTTSSFVVKFVHATF